MVASSGTDAVMCVQSVESGAEERWGPTVTLHGQRESDPTGGNRKSNIQQSLLVREHRIKNRANAVLFQVGDGAVERLQPSKFDGFLCFFTLNAC